MSEYDTDIVAWSEHQAALLRRRAAGELLNDAELDWPNIAEEIESVGNEQLHAVRSLLVQALVHMLKAEAWPLCREVPHWQSEARRFRGDAADRYVDPEADVLHARFGPPDAKYDGATEVSPGVFLEFDAAGNAIGVEVLGVRLRTGGTYGQPAEAAAE